MPLTQRAFSDLITFSRSSNATRVGPTGLVEFAPHNLLTYSEQFDNAAWTKNDSSILANAIVAPNGTETADKLIENTTNARHYVISPTLSTSTGFFRTVSVYAKAGERTRFALQEVGAAKGSFFDLSAGTVIGDYIGAPVSSEIQAVGNGWYRCSVTTVGLTFSACAIFLVSTGTTYTYKGDGASGLYIWGAQVSDGSYPLDYTPTTSAAVYGPRLDFDPVTLAARGLLVEAQRTNLLLRSEDFSQQWSNSSSSEQINVVMSPAGTLTGDKLVENANTGIHQIAQTVSALTGAYTYTCYIKAAERTHAMLVVSGGTTGRSAGFNLTTGATYTEAISGSSPPDLAADMTNAGNGWWRCRISWTADGQNSIRIYTDGGAGTGSTTGDGVSGIYIWGAQLEAGAFPTSYIPTTTTALTRSADQASVDTLSSWFNATEGTLFAEYQKFSSQITGVYDLCNNNTSVDESIRLTPNDTTCQFRVTVGSSEVVTIDLSAPLSVNKSVFAYKANDFAASVNGGAVSTDTSGALPTVSQLKLAAWDDSSSVPLNGHIRRIAFYPRRLTNAELQTLSA